MSFTSPFTTFGPLPTPSKTPISGLSGLETAIRRLEAISSTTPADEQPVVHVPTPASRDGGATPPGATPLASVRLLSEMLLGGIDPDVRPYLRRVFARTLEAVEADLALPPERRRLVPVPFLVQHWGRPCFETEEPREQGQKGMDRLLRQALWRAVDALEALALLPPGEVYQTILAEQCAQFGRVYQVLKRRAGGWVALWIVQGELRLLHHRGSTAVEHLLFS